LALTYGPQPSQITFSAQLAWGALLIPSIMGIVLFQIVVAIERIFFLVARHRQAGALRGS
jgi:hypothetical protein